MKNKLTKKIFIEANMKLITGLRIGDSKESIEIGGVDSPVVRRKDNHEPYIPGSSLKGKIRSLLEFLRNENQDSKFYNTDSDICKLFGASENNKTNQSSRKSKLIVRDSYLTQESTKWLKDSDATDMPYTEIKWENVIHRTKGTAEHPRQLERIPAGAEFTLNFVINVFDNDEDGDGDGEHYVELLKLGLALLNSDYLGGSGSRGYGQVEIAVTNKYELSTEKDYLNTLTSKKNE